MKKIFSLSCILLIAISGLSQKQALKPSLLWKIEGLGLKNPSYIMGTVHLICADKYVWRNEYTKALAKSKQVVMEIDMDDPELTGKSMKLMMLPDDKNLKDFFIAEDYENLEKYFKQEYKTSLSALSYMKPFALISFMALKSFTCDSTISYENKITAMCKAQQKEIKGLESIEDQMAIFDNMADTSISKMIMAYVYRNEVQKNTTEELMKAYVKRDIDKLYQLFMGDGSMKENINELVFNRNKKWMATIEKYSNEKSTFYAVGAGHLGGQEGVLQLLRDKGYKLTPVLK